jgi:hypothetical protein
MKIVVDKQDLINMVKGVFLSYDAMCDPLASICGRYVGGFDDKWVWDVFELNQLTEQQLFDVYTRICK